MEYKKQFSVDDEIMATGWQRFGNYVVDVIVIYTIIFILTLGIAFITTSFGSYGFVEWSQSIGTLENYIIYFAILLTYFISIETFSSRSLAKYITGTIVVLEDGSKPDFSVITKRTLCRLIPLDGLSFLGGARGWHDSISNTYVVSKKGLETKMKLFTELEEIGNPQE